MDWSAALGLRIQPEELILVVALVMARSLPLLFLNPFLGGRLVPGPVKMATAFAFVVLLLPSLSRPEILASLGGVEFAFLLLKETAIGATLGFVSLLVFLGFSAAGRLVDTQRGTNMAEAFFYQLQERTSVMGQFYGQTAVIVFLIAGGHLVFLRAYFHSFEVLPVWEYPRFAQGTMPIMTVLMRLSADVLLIAVQLSAPALIALFLTDIGFGVINRVAPQINVFIVSQPAKVAIGIGMVILVLRVLFDQFEAHGVAMLGQMMRLIDAMG
ncbi:MAG: flagellar biosynthetic protein FliR [Candidatus Eisenbacteria bacterium]